MLLAAITGIPAGLVTLFALKWFGYDRPVCVVGAGILGGLLFEGSIFLLLPYLAVPLGTVFGPLAAIIMLIARHSMASLAIPLVLGTVLGPIAAYRMSRPYKLTY